MTRLNVRLLWLPAMLVTFAGLARAQSPLEVPDATPWKYEPRGRRDPFLRPGSMSADQTGCRLSGLAGLRVDDAHLRGIVTTSSGRIALLAAPDGQSYFGRAGDPLCGGRIVAVEPAAIVVQVDDLSARAREVRKALYEP